MNYYSEKQIRKAWKRATRRIEEELGTAGSTIDVLIQELRMQARNAERSAEKDETFTLGELLNTIAGPQGIWDVSYYDGIVRAMRENREP